MIDERRRSVSESKKVDGGGNCTRDSQETKNTSSKIETQTFTILKSAFFFSIKRVLKTIRKGSICRVVLTRLFTLMHSFLPRISATLSSQNSGLKLKKSVSGYVLILMVALIPVLLFGTKYLLDLRTMHKVQLEKGNGDWYKRCAKEAALEVAKKWNPGLSLYEQRDAMYKIADDIYNASPLVNNSVIAKAIPGLEVFTKITVKNDGGFNPIQVKLSDYQSRILNKQTETVEYKEETNDKIIGDIDAADRYYSCLIFSQFNAIYRFDNRDLILIRKENGEYEIEDTIEYTMTHSTDEINKQWPKILLRSSNDDALHDSGIPYAGTKKGWIKTTITAPVDKRKNPDDDKVRIEIKNDKIKVTTDKYDVGYAEPAKCNVDIVLGIPVNGAANNVNNLDNNSYPTAGSPYYICDGGTIEYWHPTEEGKKTPISQIGRAFHDSVKKFHYTRGVNVGIVPYCGMVSLPLDRIETWAVDPVNFDRTVFPGNQNEKEYGYIRPCMLYGLFGNGDPLKEGTLSRFNSDYGIDTYSFTNVMVPQGIVKRVPEYGNNLIYYGDILSINDPAGDIEHYTEYSYSPKFMRRPVYKIPGFAGRFNFLKMGFESTNGADWSWCNPYHIVEMQSDLLKITDLLNLFYPFNFTSNQLSNFIFVPFVWANNLFQSWSKDPKYEAVDTTDATPSTMTKETSGRLSAPSKMDPNRKKALILVVNKPDWFEPGELTYLGFDNDYSEIPMIESDCIRGDINYSDTTKYFADGTKYDGTVQGAKKILKLTGFTRNSTTGWYECSDGTATLTFPKKYLVKLVVEGKVTWKSAGRQYDTREVQTCLGWGKIDWDGSKFLITTVQDSKVITSTDGLTWKSENATIPNMPTHLYTRSAYGKGIWFMSASDVSNRGCAFQSINGIDWTENDNFSYSSCSCLSYGNGVFLCINLGLHVYTTIGGNNNWTHRYSLSSKYPSGIIRGLGFCNGKWCAITWDGRFITSYDNGANWDVESLSGCSPGEVTNTYEEWYGPIYGFGRYWAVCRGDNCGDNSRIVFSRDGKTWYKADAALGDICGNAGYDHWFRGFGFNGTRFVSASDNGYFAYGDCDATIEFTNLSATTDQCTEPNKTYNIAEKQEFFIEPSQTNGGFDGAYTITFNAKNIRLISAEITNRPYVKVTPTVTKNGNEFTLNAKVPFVVTTNRNGTITYTNPDGIQTTQNISDDRRYMQVTPETHRYIKTFNSKGEPEYKVTISFDGGSLLTPAIGMAKEVTDSVTGLNLESGKGMQSGSIGDSLSYSKTDNSDQTGTATVSNGKIYCPIGSVLHVKAIPTGKKTMPGAVTFYNDNGIEDNVGTHIIKNPTQFNFRGGEEPSGTYENVTSTRGPNFGHNLSLYKVRYSYTNCYISAATLTSQWIRDYEGQYARINSSNYKPLILNDGTLAKRQDWAYTPHCTYNMDTADGWTNQITDTLLAQMSRFRDPCYSLWNIRAIYGGVSILEYQNPTGTENDYRCIPYGVEGNGLFCILGGGNYGEKVYLYINGSSDVGPIGTDWNWINVLVNIQLNQINTFMRSYCTIQTYFKNGVSKTLKSTKEYAGLSAVPGTGLAQNEGIYLVNLSSDLNNKIVAGNYICFNGDGQLSVTVTPKSRLYGTIKFNCENESNTTHELFKEGNFCIEPSQMTDNGDGRQYVSYTASNCNVTATYEYSNYSTINLTKSSAVPNVNWRITGHKKDMKWRTTSQSPAAVDSSKIPLSPNCKPIEYDGTTCYMAGMSGIYKSDDLGTTWTYVDYGFWHEYPKLCYGAGVCLWINNEGYMHIFDPELPVSSFDGVVYFRLADVFQSGFCWAGSTYANGYFLSVMCGGDVYKSVNGYDWSRIVWIDQSISDYHDKLNKGGFDSGCVYINGKWYAANIQSSDSLPIVSSTNGSTWEMAVDASSTVAPGLYAVKDGVNPVYIAYGSNRYMFMSVSGKVVTGNGISANSSYFDHGFKIINDLGKSTSLFGLSYANGRFLIKSVGGWVSYCTYHDGVIWINNQQRISQEKVLNVSTECANNNGQNTQIKTTNFVVTDISATYLKIADPIDYTIEYKKIRLPEKSAYIDYSTNPYTTYVATGRSDNSFFNDASGWFYDVKKGYFGNKDKSGYHTQIYFDIPGDYSGITDSDDMFEMVHLSADGLITYDNKKASWYYTSGLSRTYTLFKNFVNGLSNGRGWNWNDYNNGAPGSISLMMQTMTIPANVALWAGASGETLYHYAWQSSLNATYGRVFRTYDATEAVKMVTQSACAKLKDKYKDNLRIYLIKYRKQTQYKHPVTQATTNFDYSYLNNCATGTSAPYMYDITTEAQLKSALDAIYTDIEKWAGYEEAKNVMN